MRKPDCHPLEIRPGVTYGPMPLPSATFWNSIDRPERKGTGTWPCVSSIRSMACSAGTGKMTDEPAGSAALANRKGKGTRPWEDLRIGKEMNERRADEPLDDRLEWDRDGQYFHYLTKWMHALNRLSRVTEDSKYNEWAIELAKTAHARFTYIPSFGRRKRMYWKMSIDLSYPLVPSMGQHDPLDGYITFCQLQSTAERFFKKSTGADLKTEIADLAEMCEGQSWVTDDPLGIGGLLFDANRLTQLMAGGTLRQTDLLKILLDSARMGLESYARTSPWKLPAEYRLAFRELGLSIGLRAVEKVQAMVKENADLVPMADAVRPSITALMGFEPLMETIEQFWLEPASQAAKSWTEHLEINRVMLATSLAPEGFLSL